jgi:putative drug exporter of the RND superfamily
VLIWQHFIGIELHWMVLAMSVIILLAVGADYNLLLVSRFKEEVHAGLNTGIIHPIDGWDRNGSYFGGAGIRLVVRSLMTPSIAALLGKWFWWPQRIRQRPVPSPWPTPTKEAEPLTTA